MIMSELKAEIDPAEAGFAADRLHRLDDKFARYVDDGRLKGWLLTVSRHGKLAYVARYGQRDAEAGLPVLAAEMQNRVAYPEATLWGATPSLISWKGPAAREIATIADELDAVLGVKQAAA